MASLMKQLVFINCVKSVKLCHNNYSGTKRCVSTLGFVGLGNMGKHMARNLVKKGFDVIVYDVRGEVAKGMQSEGARAAASLAEVSSNVDCVVTMLPDHQSVTDVYLGKGGIIRNAKVGAVLVDSSTIDPKVPEALGSHAAKKGILFLEAPVSGGMMAAQNGHLTFMVGGPKEALALAESVLLAMGKKVFHCGGYGAGQATKMCNNLVLGISMAALAEGMNLGVRLGLDPKLLTNVINNSSGRSWSSEIYNPVPGVLENVPSSNNYQGGFLAKLLEKDLILAMNMAERSSSPVPLGSQTLRMYQAICRSAAERDFTIIYQFLKEGKLKQDS